MAPSATLEQRDGLAAVGDLELGPLQPGGLWAVRDVIGEVGGIYPDQNIDMLTAGGKLWAALGHNGDLLTGERTTHDEFLKEPNQFQARRRLHAAAGHIAIWPLKKSIEYRLAIRGSESLQESMKELGHKDIAATAKALGMLISERRKQSFAEQVSELNGLVEGEEALVIRLEKDGQHSSDQQAKIAQLKGFFLKEITNNDDEDDFGVGLILTDKRGHTGIEPEDYYSSGVYIETEGPAWLHRK